MRRRALVGLLLASPVVGALTGCAGVPQAIRHDNDPPDRVLYVIARGWHTDIGLRIEEAGGRLISFRKSFPGVRYLVFGLGNRDYLLSNRGNFGDMLRALLPGPGAVLVTALRETPQEAFGSDNVVRIHLTRAGLRNLT